MMQKVFLFVAIDVKPGKFDQFVEVLSKHIQVIRGEEGCEFIEIYRDTQRTDVVNVWEIWSSRADWDAHMVNDNSQAWRPIAAELVVGETITVMNSL
jgi:quinol monooxygenase YgiN